MAVGNMRGWESGDHKRKRSCCGNCCAWACLMVGCLIFVVILLGALWFYYVQRALPEFQIRRLNISHFHVALQNDRALLTADIQLLINAINRYNLSYKHLDAHVSSYHVNLGSAEIPPSKIGAGEMTLVIKTGVKRSQLSRDDGQGLQEDYKNKDLTISVAFNGVIDVDFGDYKMKDVPLHIFCMDIGQTDIDRGEIHRCNSKIFQLI